MNYEYKVMNVTRNKLVRDAITTKVMTFDSLDHARRFAESCEANSRIDSCRKGTQVCQYRAIEVF